jgi:hypothetical protein
MKNNFKLAALFLTVFTIHHPLSTFAQGSLTPPGSPTPTMKTLDQLDAKLEKRTPISSAPFTIGAPGSYYLAANVSVNAGNAITIATNNVTLDLNGFTIESTENPATTGCGIALGSVCRVTNITILNGFISGHVVNNAGTYSGPGFGYGVFGPNLPNANMPGNVRVCGVSISGCRYHGIYFLTNDAVVQSCIVKTVGGYGIYAHTISDSTALDCGGDAVNASVANNCSGSSNTGLGVTAGTANNCSGSSISGYGVGAIIADHCYGYSSSSTGLSAATAHSCYGYSDNGGFGLSAVTARNCYGYSVTRDGIHASAVAIACYGYNSSGAGFDGVYSSVIAIGCYGYSTAGTGVGAFIAEVCHGDTSSGTPFAVTHNVNSF